MALSKEELQTTKDGVNKAKKKDMAFAFAKTRKDGSRDPVLLIELRLSAARKNIKEEGKPPYAWGSIQMLDSKTMGFIVDKGKVKELQQALLRGLKKAHPLLTKAQIITREEFDGVLLSENNGAETEATTESTRNAAAEVEVSTEEATGARDAARERVIESKRTELQDALSRFISERDRIQVEIEKADDSKKAELHDAFDDLITDFQEKRDAYASFLV